MMALARSTILAAALTAACTTPAAEGPSGYHIVPGSFEPNRGLEGNSIFLDAPEGLILIDTGRHPAHRDRLLAYARERRRPIVAIVNTHWHLDHSTGNAEIRAAYPGAPLYATRAVEGALVGFFLQSRAAAERFLASGEARPSSGPRWSGRSGSWITRFAPPDADGGAVGRQGRCRTAAAGERSTLRGHRSRPMDPRRCGRARHCRRPRRGAGAVHGHRLSARLTAGAGRNRRHAVYDADPRPRRTDEPPPVPRLADRVQTVTRLRRLRAKRRRLRCRMGARCVGIHRHGRRGKKWRRLRDATSRHACVPRRSSASVIVGS